MSVAQQREMTTLSEADIHLCLTGAEYSLLPALVHHPLHGLRRSEALALKWSNVDLLLCKASILRSLTYVHSAPKADRLKEKTPKTKKSRRYISLTPSNCVVLRDYHESLNQSRKELGLPLLQDDDYIFAIQRHAVSA